MKNINIIICGLQGTGKTTLSKRIATELNFDYINDYTICPDGFNQNKIAEFIKTNNNYVIDLCYSLEPSVCSKLKNVLVYYLGFVSVDDEILFKLFKSKGEDITIDQIKENKKRCLLMQEECKKVSIPFVDINRNRKDILEEIFNDIKNKLMKLV